MDFTTLAAQLNTGVILPEGIVIITLLVVLIGDLIVGRQSSQWTPYVAIAGLLAAVGALYWQWDITNPISFLGSFNGDALSVVFRGIVALSAALTILMSIRYVEQSGTALAEFLMILLTATIGGMFLSGANELVTIFISLETLSISSYLLTGYMKRDPRSNEAALKYLLIGASSSAVFLYGVSLLYGLSGGETRLDAIANAMAANNAAGIGLVISLVFVIAGIAFKISAVPFHQWTPDVYEGSPTPVVAFLSVGSKAAGFALAIRLLVSAYPLVSDQWHFVFTALTILSMILGNVVALAQTSMKRLLAYSSIAQAGFVMIGLIAGTEAGYSSMIFYLLVYLFMNLGGFTCVILFSLRTGTDQITEYSGLYQKDPLLTLCLSICLLSLGGIPPLAGFFGKIYLFWAGWQAGAYGLVLLGLITSVISIYYYIRVVKMMVVKEPHEMSDAVKNYPPIRWDLPGLRPLQVSLAIALVATSLAGILSNPLFSLANRSVELTPMLQATTTATPAIRSVSVQPNLSVAAD
ncbi:NAD(P)H-quinone oxidoreductase subunit N [Desertifilum sp. FACHB-1129]|uniref:NAD(P)H-quinone oxidoreductase subunit 2 n=1 Tax=Desertifilum tharense IPPAS B-1220 TaxID=1781255 RepID=A0A1E5QEE6_9CYAN|nr:MULTISPECIES: NAD(P)H-quinone oxidoreductase subunit N [Desertifilum]MDA0212867.1 NAD(P)H-quinone oxidoreductase subunit N [Cyanobacteria bacterium FC1]MBD2311430.1 NAD(P)H-quinone oxidoreductase subunit N [Desertifilum sp. FACHB-1129]MBD2321676.1 NAD(P)H-quinone oxidoreductase subunit N [Desertifilum sp. FACHB-866]MBD2331803.1 NAD(P)H-quinone oxidoreductase subunit N [Desertifilum sp. FACHB-868]OEJ73028.1 NAD(P)H-quinone oxidoreductase subunit 2 [Desertifilum tharense IPPAS B-1220]